MTQFPSYAGPRFDTTIYLRIRPGMPYWYGDMPPVVEARAPYGLGNTTETPVGVPKGYDAYGVKVGIGIPTGVFYDYRVGECRYYANAFVTAITSQAVIDDAGEITGYQIGNEYPPPDNGYFELDVPNVFQAIGYNGPFEANLENNPLYVLMFVKFGQEFDNGEWSYEWKLYQSDPLYLERRPFVYCTSDPPGANVYIRDLWVPDDVPTLAGTTPCMPVIMERFGGKHYFNVEISQSGYYPHTTMVGLYDTSANWDDPNVIHAILEPIACRNPTGAEGSINCVDGTDAVRHLFRCIDGEWVFGGINHVDCGCYNQPRARFNTSKLAGPVPLQVEFTYETFRFDCNPRTMIWDFGDGSGSDETNPIHIYKEPGIYTVRLEVTNPNGSNSATTTITAKHHCDNPAGLIGDTICVDTTLHECQWGRWVPIEEKSATCGYSAPVASFEISATDPETRTYLFEDTSTHSPESWRWDFGDGTGSTEQNLIHTYEKHGRYNVSLTATNHLGHSSATAVVDTGTKFEPQGIDVGAAVAIGIAAVAAGALARLPAKSSGRKQSTTPR